MGAASSGCCGEEPVSVEARNQEIARAEVQPALVVADEPAIASSPKEQESPESPDVAPAEEAVKPEAEKPEAPAPDAEVTAKAAPETTKKATKKAKAKPKPTPAKEEAPKKDVAAMLDSALPKGFRQLLPNKLVWAPGLDTLSAELAGSITLFTLANTAADPFLSGGVFRIMHYVPAAYDSTFGPPSLCQFMRFCQLLEEKLAAEGTDCVVFGTPKDANAHANAAVLMGGYLVVHHGWTAAKVAQELVAEAKVGFPCPWYHSRTPVAPNLTVNDCWRSFELAASQSWISKSDVMSETACRAYITLWETYDACWLVPGEVIVAADPMSTVMDPNPKTVAALGNTPKGWVGRRPEAEVGDFNVLCWCKNANISLMVRANFSNEPGLKEIGGSYDAKAFTSKGIGQVDVGFDDVKGGVPPVKLISTMLERCTASASERRAAVLVHCKAGFGRSMVYAACWLIHKFDVPGSSLLGWLRMCRPGAITTPDQEKFLQKLSGKQDLQKLLPSGKPGGGGMFGKMFK
eukprot:TRINITY_DN47722_c0_g1_i1.p1 TRINITY_DN47722_c0_g1~~TRINITY_DN47722_c0_g1_i1.p1  ORF type:complete len:532 (+),score=124.33 TRINITY_DN47722_c0_g1_i1:42-1598(+)